MRIATLSIDRIAPRAGVLLGDAHVVDLLAAHGQTSPGGDPAALTDRTARLGGSSGRLRQHQGSLADVLAWESCDEAVCPGAVIAFGTVSGGCGLEVTMWS